MTYYIIRVNIPLKLHSKVGIFMKRTPVFALITLNGGLVCTSGFCVIVLLKIAIFVYLAISGTHPLLIRKQNLFVLFICNIKKLNITSVQINMKQVLYMASTT